MSQAPSPEHPSQRKRGSPLRVVLFAIMLVMIGLMAWDRYARSASESAFKKVAELVETSSEAQTPDDLHQLLGRQADADAQDKGHYALETYSWRRGMLLDRYVLTVIYRKEGEQLFLHEAALNREPDENDLPNAPNRAENAEAKAATE